MREIRFRVWNEAAKEMIILDLFQANCYEQDFILRNREANERESWIDDNACDIKWPIMQFTGMKDKNGNDLYDGDLVKDGSVEYQYIYGVYWHPQFQWSLKIMENNQFVGTLKDPEYTVPEEMKLELLGNIYQNKDLLNG